MRKEKRWLMFVTALGAAIRLYFWYALRGPELVVRRLPDDALYYFTIARNLAHGYGISFDTVHATNGMHPLWLFLITPIFALHLSNWGAVHVVLLLQSLLDTIVVWLIGSTVYTALNDTKQSNRVSASVVSALIYAANIPGFIGWINGLETTLAALMLLVWLRVYVKARESGLWIVLGIVTGFTLLARTDLFIVLTPMILYALRKYKTDRPKLLLAGCVAAVVIAPWVIWNIIHFGTPLQSSAEAVPIFAMKKYEAMYGSQLNIYAHLAIEAARNILKPFWYSTLAVSIFLIGFAISARRKSLTEVERIVFLLVAGGILLLTIHTLFRGFIRDWYVLELIPLFLVGFGIAMGSNAGKTEVRAGGRLAFASVILICLWLVYPSKRMTSQYDMVYRGIPVVQELTKSANVASFNAGYYSYFASRPGSVVDLDGVVSAQAVDAIKGADLHGYLDRQQVNYIFEFEGDFGGYVNLIDKRMLDSFALVDRDTISSSGAMLLYRRKRMVN